MDNFKGQITESVIRLLETHDVHVCLLPPNTTDLLQPRDIAVNKPAKEFLREEFEQWYSEHVMKQLEDHPDQGTSNVDESGHEQEIDSQTDRSESNEEESDDKEDHEAVIINLKSEEDVTNDKQFLASELR